MSMVKKTKDQFMAEVSGYEGLHDGKMWLSELCIAADNANFWRGVNYVREQSTTNPAVFGHVDLMSDSNCLLTRHQSFMAMGVLDGYYQGFLADCAIAIEDGTTMSDDEIINRALTITTNRVKALEIEVVVKTQQLSIDSPKAEVHDLVTEQGEMVQIGIYAKNLSQEYGLKVPENGLRTYLRNIGYLMQGRGGGEKNRPYSQFVPHMFVEKRELCRDNRYRMTTYITARGQLRLAKKIVEHFGEVI